MGLISRVSSRTYRISSKMTPQIGQENIDDLCMEPDEALKDAIDQLNLQKANLLYIIKEVPEDGHLITKLSDSLKLNQTITEQIPLLTKTANYVLNGQPDWASETTLKNAVKIIKLVGRQN